MPGRDPDLAALLASERGRESPAITESLLVAAASGDPVAAAARRLLRRSAPWALRLGDALVGAVEAAVKQGDRAILIRTELRLDRRDSLRQLAGELQVSAERIAQRRDRAAGVLRDFADDAAVPLGWAVRYVGRELGSAAPRRAGLELLHRLQLMPTRKPSRSVPTRESSEGGESSDAQGRAAQAGVDAGEVLLWLAGPYRSHRRYSGWLLKGPQAAEPALSGLLRQLLMIDGGVSDWAAISSRLSEAGVRLAFQEQWANACGIAVVDGTAAWLADGPLPRTVETLLEAAGRALTVEELRRFLCAAGRPHNTEAVVAALESRAFRPARRGHELTHWPVQPSRQRRQRRPSAPEEGPDALEPERLFDSLAEGHELVAGRFEERAFGRHVMWEEWHGQPQQHRQPQQLREPQQQRGQACAANDVRAASVEGLVWFVVEVDASVLTSRPSPAPEVLIRTLGIGWHQRRTFASRFGPLTITNDGAEPSHSTLRPLALGAGADVGDRLQLGFGQEGQLEVELMRSRSGT